jgi:ectonucleotide pyrophosphatase/phosphodiesterase family protein 5
VRRFGSAAVVLTLAIVVALVASAGAPAKPGSATPLRVYVVVLDGLMPQEVGPLTPELSELRAGGTWYEEARAVFPAETLPNHAAMMTGYPPQRSGIVGNDFWVPGGGGAQKYRMQFPKLLGADTLTTRLENACAISTATVQSKGYLYGLFRKEPPDPEPTDTTSRKLPNNADPGVSNPDNPGNQRQADYHWRPLADPAYIGDPDDHTLDEGTMERGFLPWLDSDAPTPQFAFVNLGDIDRSGHVDASGISGVSAFRQAALTDTDRLIGEMVDDLKASGAWGETVLIVTSDHGMDWSPPDNGSFIAGGLRSIDVSYQLSSNDYTADYERNPGKNTPANPASKGDFAVVPGGGSAAVYLEEADDVAPVADLLAAHPAVALVATRTLVPGHPTLSEMGMDNRWNGDLVVFVKEGYAVRDQASSNPLPGNHGHPATQHSVLLVTGGHPVLDDAPQSVFGEQVYDPESRPFSAPDGGPGNLSIAPTVAALFGIGEPSGGYPGPRLTEAFEPYAFKKHAACGAAGGH